MEWIKRNLGFVLGSFIAVALMGAGGWYLYTQISAAGGLADKLQSQYAELQRLTTLNPHPGNEKINNVKAAKEEALAIRGFVTKTKPYFEGIAPIPDLESNKLRDSDFASALRVTVNELHHDAEQQSVDLPKDYYFTFEAQRKIMIFDHSSLYKLAVQLGEIKAISEILFDARVNSLDYIRREMVSTDDKNQSDYLSQKTEITPLAELAPYEVKFRCFSAELAQVLGSFATSPNGFIVKTINVEPSGAAEEPGEGPGVTGAPQPVVQPQYPANPMPRPYNVPGGDPRSQYWNRVRNPAQP